MAHSHLRDAIRVTYFQPTFDIFRRPNLQRHYLGLPQEIVETPGYYVKDDTTRVYGNVISETYYSGVHEYIKGYPPSVIASYLAWRYHSVQAPFERNDRRHYIMYRHNVINFILDINDVGDAGQGHYDPDLYPDFVRWNGHQEIEINGGLTDEFISKYLKTRNSTNNEDNESEICVVCQGNLCQENHKIATLDCGHEYHPQCIKKWLRQKNLCPLCKATALPRLEDVEQLNQINVAN